MKRIAMIAALASIFFSAALPTSARPTVPLVKAIWLRWQAQTPVHIVGSLDTPGRIGRGVEIWNPVGQPTVTHVKIGAGLFDTDGNLLATYATGQVALSISPDTTNSVILPGWSRSSIQTAAGNRETAFLVLAVVKVWYADTTQWTFTGDNPYEKRSESDIAIVDSKLASWYGNGGQFQVFPTFQPTSDDNPASGGGAGGYWSCVNSSAYAGKYCSLIDPNDSKTGCSTLACAPGSGCAGQGCLWH